MLVGRDAPVPVLIGSKEPKPMEPIGTETGTDWNRLEPKPKPIRTDWNRNRNRSEPIGTETETDQNRLEPKPEPIRTDSNRLEPIRTG